MRGALTAREKNRIAAQMGTVKKKRKRQIDRGRLLKMREIERTSSAERTGARGAGGGSVNEWDYPKSEGLAGLKGVPQQSAEKPASTRRRGR